MNPCKATLPPISKKKNNQESEVKKMKYASKDVILLKLAMKNSMMNNGREKVVFAKNMVIRPKRLSLTQSHHRRRTFQTMPSRLSIMSNSQDLSITPTIIDDQFIINPQDFLSNSFGCLRLNSIEPNKSEDKKIRYSSNNMILLKSAMKNSTKKEGMEKVMFARNMVTRAKRLSKKQWNHRRRNFQIMPSRLSIMSDSQDFVHHTGYNR